MIKLPTCVYARSFIEFLLFVRSLNQISNNFNFKKYSFGTSIIFIGPHQGYLEYPGPHELFDSFKVKNYPLMKNVLQKHSKVIAKFCVYVQILSSHPSRGVVLLTRFATTFVFTRMRIHVKILLMF